ncbi:hypothetical protein, partial [Paenibacillus sp. YIM B09110]|uniref:hypothetical protein n=1 Tax=Paenibacillus sp. YIM B09110 TaxID=3126102 RepID=UPI00301E554F
MTGIAKTMEFSKDGGTTWAKYVSAASMGDMRGDIALLVRKYITGVTLTGQTAALNFTAATPNLKITAATGTAFKEGSEDGQLITVKLTNGDINANPDNATVKLTGLPDGITQGKVTWLSKTSLTIALVGNSTVDYDTNATATVTLDEGQVTPAQMSDLTSPVTLKATVETTPAAPAITFSFDGINAGKLKGIKAGMMEYSLDGGTGYITAV